MYILSYAFTFCAAGIKVSHTTQQSLLRRLGHSSLGLHGKKGLFRVAFFSAQAGYLLWSNHNFRGQFIKKSNLKWPVNDCHSSIATTNGHECAQDVPGFVLWIVDFNR